MKVSVYSEKAASEESTGWHKDCSHIKYSQNSLKKQPDNVFSLPYYTLTFTYTFKHDQDSVFFAYAVPYSYSDLRHDLQEIEQNEARS